ncbi:MAG: SBBP repeat-containing protein [Acidobacteriota bacterium]|nr:SBBP repeat-containing protein [Acidobacteriota bacterium]
MFFIQEGLGRHLIRVPGMTAVFTPEGAEFHDVHAIFLGAKGDLGGLDPMGSANFLVGRDPSQWRTGLPAHRKILYSHLYPGIDLLYSGKEGRVKSEYTLAPGARPEDIRIQYSAALSIDAGGRLHAAGLTEDSPEIYQDASRGRISVAGRYRLLDAHTAGFEIDAYDASLPLVIDPVISYATYMGGTGLGAITGVAVDSAGDLYAAGWTEALNFPIVLAEQAAHGGSVDAFIVKLNPTGTALLYATYIGGSGDDRAAAIAVNGSGQACVTGSTASANFPLLLPLRTNLGGAKTAFVLKLNATGNQLLYSTYLGGTNYDLGTAIAVDAAGNAYVAGDTLSSNFPVSGGVQAVFGGGTDVFVSKLTTVGALSYSTYLGGAGNEHAGGIAVDTTGAAYVAGGTTSTNFPVAGAIQPVNRGAQDAFIAKLSPSGGALSYSTYLGGSGATGSEQANGIAVDGSGNAYVAGVTNSTDFPVTAGVLQTQFKGVSDAFAAKLNPSGSALVYSTYLGGSDLDWGSAIGIDGSGDAYIAGYSSSGDFPQSNPTQAGFGGLYDAFVSELNATGNALSFSTWFGGGGSEIANAIAIDASGNMYLGGQTNSVNLPLVSAIQSANTGGSVGWLARIGVTAPPPQIPAAVSVTPASGSGNAVVFSAQFSDSGGAAALTTVSLLVNSSVSTAVACYVIYAGGVLSLANDNPANGSQVVTFGGGSQQNSSCIVNGAGSSVSLAGGTWTLNLSLTFLPGFAGAKTTYLYAADAGANTGWVARGAWTVVIPPPQPSADSVSPNGSSGGSQTLTFVFSDNQNATNLIGMAMLFNTTSANVTNSCDIVYDRNAGTVALVWDSGAGSDPKALGSPVVLKNSQCQVGAVSAAASGLSQILTVSITFTAAFSGTKNIYMYGSDAGVNTGWVLRGTYLVAAGGLPTANSVVPTSGSGPAQRFSFTASDQGGSGFITGMAMLLSTSPSTANACSMVFDRTRNVVSLAFDTPANGAASVTPGSPAIVSNSQCSLNGANTTVVMGVTSIVVTVDLTFNANWFGAKNIYLLASETTVNTGFVTVGGWTVTGGAPTADSVSPSSGSGTSPNFTFTVSDSTSQLNITGMSMLITAGAPTSLANACYLVYNRVNATIGLYNNSGTILSTKPIGSSANLFNTQCAVGFTVMVNSGNSVSFTINTVFLSFSGAKSVYLQANEPNTNSGWVQRGAWTVP